MSCMERYQGCGGGSCRSDNLRERGLTGTRHLNLTEDGLEDYPELFEACYGTVNCIKKSPQALRSIASVASIRDTLHHLAPRRYLVPSTSRIHRRMPKIENIFTFHPTSVVAQDVDLVGDVTIGPSCIIHPSCTIVALGPIIFGSGCIVEEQAVICNRRKTPMEIGSDNLFSVGCRVEAKGIGSYNVFEAKCKVSPDVEVGDHCVIGASCTVVAEPSLAVFDALEKVFERVETTENQLEAFKETGMDIRKLPNYTIIFGDRSEMRKWSGEGQVQARALHAKHIQYLSETLPKFQRTRAVGPPKSKEATAP